MYRKKNKKMLNNIAAKKNVTMESFFWSTTFPVTLKLGSGALGWQGSAEIITNAWKDNEDLTEKPYLISSLAALGGATACTLTAILVTSLEYYSHKKTKKGIQTSPINEESPLLEEATSKATFKEYFAENGPDLINLFLAAVITDTIWQLYHNTMVKSLAEKFSGGEDTSLQARMCSMLIIFGILSTLTFDISSKLLGFLLSDSAWANFIISLIVGVGGSFSFGVAGEIMNAASVSDSALRVLIAGSVVTLSGFVFSLALGGTLNLYSKCTTKVETTPDDIESQKEPIPNTEIQISLAQEAMHRFLGAKI